MRLIGIGDNVCDAYLHLEKMFPGGQTMNATVFAKQMGIDSAYIGVFGDDEVAEHNQATLTELGVDFSRSRHEHGENGLARVTLVDGDRVFLGSNRGGVARLFPIKINEEDMEYIKDFSVIHTSNNSFIDDQLPVLMKTGVPISYDFSKDWMDDAEWVAKIAPCCEFGFMSLPDDATDEEARQYCRDLHDKGCRNVVATQGSKGGLLFDGENFFFQPSDYVKPVDTLGAGDSFATAILVKYFEFKEAGEAEWKKDSVYYKNAIESSMRFAAKFAAKVCLTPGAFDHAKKIDPVKYAAKQNA